VAWLRRLDDELDNLRAALKWSLESDVPLGLRLASALRRYWTSHSPLQEGIDWLSQFLRQLPAVARTMARAKALTALSYLTWQWQDQYPVSRSLAEEGLALYRELGDQQGIASALLTLGLALGSQGDVAAQHSLVLESLALYRTLGATVGVAEALGILAMEMGHWDYARARAYLEESLALCRELGHIAGLSDGLYNLGVLTLRQGDFAAARPWLEESLELQRGLSLPGVAYCIDALGELALRQGDYEQARTYFAECMALYRETGRIVTSVWAIVNLGYAALRQGDAARAQALFVEGQERFNEVGNKIGAVYALEGLASLAVAHGRAERAVRIFAGTDAMREAIGDRRPPIEQADIDRDFTLIRTQLDEATIAAAQAEGCAMTIEQAIAYALADEDQVATDQLLLL
jgi:tetratricopeptide (TPR) repeat protein